MKTRDQRHIRIRLRHYRLATERAVARCRERINRLDSGAVFCCLCAVSLGLMLGWGF